MQEHLASADPAQETTRHLQRPDDRQPGGASRPPTGSPASGVADAATWAALLALPPVAVDWTGTAKPSS